MPPPEISARDARLELARRYLHIYGPTTSGAFRKWAGISLQCAASAFETLGDSLTPVRTPIGDAWILTADEAAFRAAPGPSGGGVSSSAGASEALSLARRLGYWGRRWTMDGSPQGVPTA